MTENTDKSFSEALRWKQNSAVDLSWTGWKEELGQHWIQGHVTSVPSLLFLKGTRTWCIWWGLWGNRGRHCRGSQPSASSYQGQYPQISYTTIITHKSHVILSLFQLEIHVYHIHNGICICVMKPWTHCYIQALSALICMLSPKFFHMTYLKICVVSQLLPFILRVVFFYCMWNFLVACSIAQC